MTVTLGASPNSNWQAIAPLLQALGCAPGDGASPETWYVGEQNLPEGKLLLAYTYPRQALLNAMEAGQEPAAALRQWEEHTQALLTLYKNNRRRAVLVNVQRVASNLQRAAQILAGHWQQEIDLPDSAEKISEKAAAPYCQLIATIAIHQNKQLSPLLAQLEACSLPVAEHEQAAEPEQDINALYRELKQFRQQTEQFDILAKQYQELDEKHLALIDQSDRVQEELEQSLIANKEGQTFSDALKSENEELKTALARAEEQQAPQEEESQLLIEQLHLVQEELELSLIASKEERTASDALRSEIEELKAALAKTEEQLKAGSAEIDRLRTSLNSSQAQQNKDKEEATKLRQELDKATAERKNLLADLETTRQQHGQNKATLEEENQLVIEQLHLVQEELERQLISKQALEKQLKQATQEQDHALAVANNQINRLQNELHQLKNSTAWKAAAPVRALGRPFKRTSPDKRKLKKQANQLANSRFFDADWYLKTYPDVAEGSMNPAEHYLKFGADEGRDPSQDFDTQWYLQANPDVREFGINPLIHFLNDGQAEGRAPNPRVQNSLPSPKEAK